MADKRITELSPIDAAGVESDIDVLALADVSAAETKKVTPTAVVIAGLTGGVPDGSIPGSKIEENTITSKELGPDSVTSVELADNAVDTGAIQNKAVTQEKLADGAVGEGQLADGAVTADKLADGAIGDARAREDQAVSFTHPLSGSSGSGGSIPIQHGPLPLSGSYW